MLVVVAVEFVHDKLPVQPLAVNTILEPLQIVELVLELTVGVGAVTTVTGKATL